ncbi:MAG TPA: hypothetical protein VMH04_19225 [Candidatus Solibacter sp.]|nr:hypothetical protein [Candidatus Solibacter sp.]
MVDLGRRPFGRLFCFAVAAMAAFGFRLTASATPVPQSGGTTTVADTVLLADGTPAQGNLIISWPAFVTTSGTAVAAGVTTTALGAGGALSIALIPNAGATPAGAYYTVVYQLGPGEVKTEYWLVPTTSPASLATVRTTPGTGTAAQPVSMQYVNSQLATKANDSSVVHLSGTETISGTKTFASAPTVPNPTSTSQVANKAYVDASVSSVGAGVFLPEAGGTMTGPITLPADPAAPMQASTKNYVDTGFAAKADVVAGLVPATELGSGAASSGSCLLGNGSAATWGTCGGGTGTGNLSTNPTATQSIAQPVGTQFSSNNLANIRYVTSSWNWSQTPADNLGSPGSLTIHLSPCPLGLDTASSSNFYSYKVYIAAKGTPEAVPVTGGTCTPGASSGTIAVTTANAHAAGYTVSSASSGIQEAWNDAWVSDTGIGTNGAGLVAPYVKLTADTQYNVYATVYLRGRGGVLDGAGALIVCSTRDRCIYIGTTQGRPFVNHHKLYNLSGASTVNVDGVQVASEAASSGTYTITTASPHPFVLGDTVDCETHSQTVDHHWSAPVLSVPNSTTFTVSFGTFSGSAGANTFGFCNLLNAFIENNSDHVAVQDINLFQSNPAGMGFFTYGIVNDNDQQFIIERASNRSSLIVNATANWPIGAFVYQRTDQGNAGITYLHNSEFTGLNCVSGGGNGMVISDSVCQGFPMYGVRYFGVQPATINSVYQESTGGTVNPLYGYAAQAGYVLSGLVHMVGSFPANGFSPTFPSASGGSAATVRNYFVVPRSSTLGAGPVMYIGQSNASNSGGVNITTEWPSPQLTSVGTLTFDLLVTIGSSATAPAGTGNYAVATGITFGSACGTNGMCSFVDTQAAPTSYSVPAQQYVPTMWFWPTTLAMNSGMVFMPTVQTTPSAVAAVGTLGVSVVADRCSSAGPLAQRSPIWIACSTSDGSGGSGSIATVYQQLDQSGGGPVTNSKGRLNLGRPINNTPNDLVTLQDSNFAKTMATSGERPSSDAGDMAIGLDQTGGMAQRAATSISEYINAIPSGTNFLERLTGAAKTFNVPVTVNGNLTVASGTVTLPVTGSGSQCLHVSATGAVSGTGADCGSGAGSGTVNGGLASQVAVYSGSGTAVSGDSSLSDSGTTLSYAGSGGISAASGNFSGNVTVNGQLLVAGPWMVSSPIPGTAMSAAGSGTSALGISNDGNFYISANGGTPAKVATSASSSFFTNLTQEDNYDVGQFVVGETTANPQAMHVYSAYASPTSWQRTSVGYDTADGYAVVKSESSTSGGAPGLGFWLNSGLKWVIDATSNFKPWTDQAFNIGSFSGSSGIGLRPATVYVAGNSSSDSGFELGKFANNSYELCNDTTNGTVINGLAVLTSAGCAVKPASAATSGVIGVVIANAGSSGTVTLVRTGSAFCSFDASPTVVGDYVVASSTANSGFFPLCHDWGSTLPSGQQVLGRVLQATSGSATAQMFFDMPGSSVGPSSVSSVFGRTGAVTATSGDYSVSQITGAAPLASPTFTGTVTLPSGSVGTTQSAGDNSTKLATTAYVKSEAQFAWSCPIGGTTSVAQYCNWTLPAGLTITGFDLAASTAPAGCTTSPVVQVWDGNSSGSEVGSYSVTMANGTNFATQVTGSTSVASGHPLRLKVTTAAAGCTTNAANVVATVTYQMQN